MIEKRVKPEPAESAQPGIWRCSCCGTAMEHDHNQSAWRWNGTVWEHKCPENHPQHGHEPARYFPASPAASQPTQPEAFPYMKIRWDKVAEGTTAEQWRVGRKVGRTIYRGDELIGLMDTPELAQQVVKGQQELAALRGELDEIRRHIPITFRGLDYQELTKRLCEREALRETVGRLQADLARLSEVCSWCKTNAREAAARHEGPHATWCPKFREEQRGGVEERG